MAQPFFRSTPAEVRANSEEKKRVSWPTTSLGFFFCALTCPAMAAEARRTPAKVKSSAMTPRQPEVPKWIVCFVTGDYCILARELKSGKNGASGKEKGGRGGPLASTYRWKGKVESAKEFLLLIKTSRRRFATLREVVRQLHSYQVPEIIALPITAGSRAYLDWIAASIKSW